MEGLIHGGAYFRNFTVPFLSLLWVLSLVIAGSTRGAHYYDFDNGDGKDNVKKYNTIYIRLGKQKFYEENYTFWYISMPSLHNYDVTFSDATF